MSPTVALAAFQDHIAKVFKLEEIRQAHELMEANDTQGKIVVTI